MLTEGDITALRHGWNDDPALSLSLNADTYTDPQWIDIEREAVFARTWQWVCHREKLSTPSSYVAVEVAGRPVSVICDGDGELRAFYNVCKHRGHELLAGEGQIKGITCPYHAWTYDLTGQLKAAPKTNNLPEFSVDDICLDQVLVETFCGFVYVNLDPTAAPMTQQTGALEAEIRKFAPDVEDLTFSLRLTYDIKSNWKVVVDNFLECYHCPTAHKEFCELVDMDTYEITTHGIYSSHMAEARKNANSPYPIEGATVTDHAVWWLWPNTCLMRYPGRGNFIIMHVIPVGPHETYETYDFYFETADQTEAEVEAIRYIDETLQVEDIAIVESVQRGMATPAFQQGRFVYQPESGMTEHAVHHFHGLMLEAYASVAR